MESLPADIFFKILCLLDHQNLATAQQVCRKWKLMASENILWSNLFEERWGRDNAAFYAPIASKSWRDVYEVRDRCDRVGLGLKIIREGDDCYLIHHGEIQRHLSSRRQHKVINEGMESDFRAAASLAEREPCIGLLDRILFFLGDLESASAQAKRSRLI